MSTYVFRAEFLNGYRHAITVQAPDLREAVDEFDRRTRGNGRVVGLGVTQSADTGTAHVYGADSCPCCGSESYCDVGCADCGRR